MKKYLNLKKHINSFHNPFVSNMVHKRDVKFCKPAYYKEKLYILRL